MYCHTQSHALPNAKQTARYAKIAFEKEVASRVRQFEGLGTLSHKQYTGGEREKLFELILQRRLPNRRCVLTRGRAWLQDNLRE